MNDLPNQVIRPFENRTKRVSEKSNVQISVAQYSDGYFIDKLRSWLKSIIQLDLDSGLRFTQLDHKDFAVLRVLIQKFPFKDLDSRVGAKVLKNT